VAQTQVVTGGLVLAADMNNALDKRIGSNALTVNSVSLFGSPVINTLTVPLNAGLTYALRWTGRVSSSTAGDVAYIRIRPNNALATEFTVAPIYIPTTYTGGFAVDCYCEFVAPLNGTYTFVVTLQLGSGTGPLVIRSSTTGPSVFTCDYVGM
jgi:hypothetical protein